MNNVTIRRYTIVFCLLSFSGALLTPVFSQTDTIHRSVTVERDFQPVIPAAGKVATRPSVVETVIEPTPVEYSAYTSDVTPGSTFLPLRSQPNEFAASKPFDGYVRGGVGHTNTLFNLDYTYRNGKKSAIRVYAHHKAQWGLRGLSNTKVGLNYTYHFKALDLFVGANGGNIYYTKYGRFYDYSLVNPSPWERTKTLYAAAYAPGASPFSSFNTTSLWTAEAFVGVRSNKPQAVRYTVQTGYALFAKPDAVSEHQIRTRANVEWSRDKHHAGLNFYMQNNFMSLSGNLAATISSTLYNSRHNFRMEPFYAYESKRVQLHAGVNFDVNVGRGPLLTNDNNVSFAPSPHIRLKALLVPDWLSMYADVTGSLGLGSLQAFMESNRYRLIHAGITSHASSTYKPVDAEAGFHIRPHRDLLLEIHGGYALSYYTLTLIAVTDSAVFNKVNQKMQAGDFAYADSHYGCGKIGGRVNYHYQDIVRVQLYGDYYFWHVLKHVPVGYTFNNQCAALTAFQSGTNNTVYDRANWELGLRVDGRIDKHWSLYSDNHFAGSRLALANDKEHRLKPTVELDLGVQYETRVGKRYDRKVPNLILFAQVNDFIHYKNDLYYGYTSPGINFLIGAMYRF